MIAVVITSNGGGRSLLRTADSVARQRSVRDLMLALPADRKTPLADSIVRRLGGTAVRHGTDGHAAVNEAVRLTTADILALVPAGITLLPGAPQAVGAAFQRSGVATAIASPVRVHTPDGLGFFDWRPSAIDAPSMLTDPRGVPPVMILRRSTWDELGGVDGTLGDLCFYDLWLRLAFRDRQIDVLNDAIVARELADVPADSTDTTDYLSRLGLIFASHHTAIEQAMDDVLVAREMRFGQLRETHRRLIAERDAGLAELDRVRAETAHHRSFMAFHGLDAFEWGDLRRTDPMSRDWGYDRGGPVDRRYIEAFIEAHSSDVRGVVLEVQEDDFTRLAGGPRVVQSAVLDVDASNRRATIVTDLRCAPELAADQFDCVILTQTVHVIDDMAAVAREVHRILRPGGVVLATMPAASRVCLEYGETGDLWRVTPAGAAALFEQSFGSGVDVEPFGNVLTNVAFLHGLGAQELTDTEYAVQDPYFPALTGIRARKGDDGRTIRGAVLLYHRIEDGQDAHGLNVPASCFDAHLTWLQRECTIVPLERLLECETHELPERAIAITFDDGYEDNLAVAAPLLQRHEAAATFFATTRWLDEEGEYWWDELERILLGPHDLPSSIEVTLTGETLRLMTASPAERSAAHWRLHALLVHRTAAERDRAMNSLRGRSPVTPPRYRPMRAAALRDLARLPGMTLGAHSVTHVALPDQPAEVAAREIAESRDRLSALAGAPIQFFAYPYGALDAHVARLARREVGWAFSCEERAVPASFDAARVPRLDVKAWPIDELARRVAGLFQATSGLRPAR